MTAPLSTSNTGLRTFMYYRLSQMKSRFIALCLMSLFSFPLLAAAVDINAYADLERRIGMRPDETHADLEARVITLNTIAGLLAIAGFVLLFVLFLQGLFTAKESFRYLWNKKYTDMDMSLPISTDTRFAGSVISGFGTYFLPQLIAVLLSLLLLLPADGFAEQYRQLSANDVNSSDIGNIIEFFRNNIGYVLAANAMQYFFSLMIISFCGRKLTANIVPFVFLLGVPFTTFFLGVISGVSCYGVNPGEMMYGPLWDATPIGMILSANTFYPSQYAGIFHDLWWLRGLMWSAVYCTAAYFMIKHRREERAGSAFVYKPGRYATEFLIMLASASAVYLPLLTSSRTEDSVYGIAGLIYRFLNIPDAVLITTWIVVNLIIFVVIELVSREKLKKPKKLGLAVGRFAVSAALSFLVCFGFMKSDGFGAAGYVPEVSDVVSVDVNCSVPGLRNNYARLRSEDAVKMISDFHHRIVTERPDDSALFSYADRVGLDYEYFCSFNVNYEMISGGQVSRTYYLPASYSKDLLQLWFGSGAFASEYNNIPDTAKDRYVSISVYDTADTGIPYEKFVAALKRDAAKATYEDLFVRDRVDCVNTLIVVGDESYWIKVWSSFDETLALMREYNCDPFGNMNAGVVKYYMYKATSYGSFTSARKAEYSTDDHGYTDLRYEPVEYRELTEEQAKELLKLSSVNTVYENSRDIYIIVPVSEHISEYDGSITYLTGTGNAEQYYVTEHNCDTAVEVYANAPAVSAEDLAKYLGEEY